jgi:transcriptional regulator with XRE-family HTH domain
MGGRRRAPITGGGVAAELANRLRDLRDSSGMTLREMAAKSGYSPATLSLAESGRKVPSWDVVEAFVQTCGDVPATWQQLWQVAAGAEQQPVGSDTARPSSSQAGSVRTSAESESGEAETARPANVGGTSSVGPRRRPRRALVLGALIGVVAGLSAYLVVGWVGTVPPAAAPAADRPSPAQDGTDPYLDHCNADETPIDRQPVNFADGRPFGALLLMFSPSCQAAWGYLNAPNEPRWTTHIAAHRTPGHAVAPSSFAGDAAFGSWGNVLSVRGGCVYVEAYVVTGAKEGPHARSACFNPGRTGAPTKPHG